MKRFLIPLIAVLALPTAVNAGVDPAVHNLCKDVSDYMGCVKANSKNEKKNKKGFWLKLAEGLEAAAEYREEESRREEDRLDREARRHELLNRNNPKVIYRDSTPTTTIIQQPTYDSQRPANCQGYSGRHVSSFSCF